MRAAVATRNARAGADRLSATGRRAPAAPRVARDDDDPPVRAALPAGLLCLPGSAAALPGDAPFAPLSPADGATLPVDPDGIPVSYTCPVYRIADPGFPLFGGPKDYGVTLSTSPALGADGRLADGTLEHRLRRPRGRPGRMLIRARRGRVATADPGDARRLLLAGLAPLHRLHGQL